MPAEENKAQLQRIYEEVFNQGNTAIIDETVAPNFVDHDPMNPTRDAEGVKQFTGAFRAAFPDGRFTVEDVLADGEKVIARFTVTGTHQGNFMGIPATGNAITVTGIDIMEFADGKAVEHWGEIDSLGLLQQLGIIPSMG